MLVDTAQDTIDAAEDRVLMLKTEVATALTALLDTETSIAQWSSRIDLQRDAISVASCGHADESSTTAGDGINVTAAAAEVARQRARATAASAEIEHYIGELERAVARRSDIEASNSGALALTAVAAAVQGRGVLAGASGGATALAAALGAHGGHSASLTAATRIGLEQRAAALQVDLVARCRDLTTAQETMRSREVAVVAARCAAAIQTERCRTISSCVAEASAERRAAAGLALHCKFGGAALARYVAYLEASDAGCLPPLTKREATRAGTALLVAIAVRVGVKRLINALITRYPAMYFALKSIEAQADAVPPSPSKAVDD